MRDALRRLIARMTPWYSEDEAARRDESTADVQQRSQRARLRADAVLKSYQDADKRLGKMSGKPPD